MFVAPTFYDLIRMPTCARPYKTRTSRIQGSVLTSPKNVNAVREAEEINKKREQSKAQKEKFMKEAWSVKLKTERVEKRKQAATKVVKKKQPKLQANL